VAGRFAGIPVELYAVLYLCGVGSGADIIDEIILKFQTTFITDNEYYELSSRSFDDVALETTIKNGYIIDENGLISRKDVEEDI
jgi:hypothetical protein